MGDLSYRLVTGFLFTSSFSQKRLVGLEGRWSAQPLSVTPFYGLMAGRLASSLTHTLSFLEADGRLADWDIYSIQRRHTVAALDLSLFLLDSYFFHFHNAEGLQLGSSALLGGKGV